MNELIDQEYKFAREKINFKRNLYYFLITHEDQIFPQRRYLRNKLRNWGYRALMFILAVGVTYRLILDLIKKLKQDEENEQTIAENAETVEIPQPIEEDDFNHEEEVKGKPEKKRRFLVKLVKSLKGYFQQKVADLSSDFEIKYADNITERLSNVKGIEEVREEVEEIISILKNPETYIEAGAKLPKGVLLCGKPGTGKTLIARAIAGEAGVNFIYLTGSDFDEMYVGVGAARMRKLFDTARENAPVIIFIDEIDSLLAASRRKGEHSSSRATINQFLAEMDGFNKLDNLLVIGATNHERDLDPAAVRPGRFDKIIHISVPDESGRTEIIKFYLNKIKLLKKNLDPVYIAKLTPGFTGAEIENLINLAIVRAVNMHKVEVDMDDISESRDRVFMGIANKKYSMTEKRRYHVALHEAGHTLVCYKSESCRKTLEKVTVIPRGPAMGVTMRLNDEEALNSKNEFLDFIDMCMGGHVAEELVYGSDHVTAGCSSDLDKATGIAQQMVKKYGMYGDKVGYIYVQDEGYTWDKDETSDKYKNMVDSVVKEILKESHDRVYNLLKKDANELKNIAQMVFQYDTLNCKDCFNFR